MDALNQALLMLPFPFGFIWHKLESILQNWFGIALRSLLDPFDYPTDPLCPNSVGLRDFSLDSSMGHMKRVYSEKEDDKCDYSTPVLRDKSMGPLYVGPGSQTDCPDSISVRAATSGAVRSGDFGATGPAGSQWPGRPFIRTAGNSIMHPAFLKHSMCLTLPICDTSLIKSSADQYDGNGSNRDCSGHGQCRWNKRKGNHCMCDAGYVYDAQQQKCCPKGMSIAECTAQIPAVRDGIKPSATSGSHHLTPDSAPEETTPKSVNPKVEADQDADASTGSQVTTLTAEQDSPDASRAAPSTSDVPDTGPSEGAKVSYPTAIPQASQTASIPEQSTAVSSVTRRRRRRRISSTSTGNKSQNPSTSLDDAPNAEVATLQHQVSDDKKSLSTERDVYNHTSAEEQNQVADRKEKLFMDKAKLHVAELEDKEKRLHKQMSTTGAALSSDKKDVLAREQKLVIIKELEKKIQAAKAGEQVSLCSHSQAVQTLVHLVANSSSTFVPPIKAGNVQLGESKDLLNGQGDFIGHRDESKEYANGLAQSPYTVNLKNPGDGFQGDEVVSLRCAQLKTPEQCMKTLGCSFSQSKCIDAMQNVCVSRKKMMDCQVRRNLTPWLADPVTDKVLGILMFKQKLEKFKLCTGTGPRSMRACRTNADCPTDDQPYRGQLQTCKTFHVNLGAKEEVLKECELAGMVELGVMGL